MPHQTCTRFLVPGTPVGHEVPDVPVDMYKVLNVPADMYEVPDTPAAMYDHPDAPMDMYEVPIALPYMCEVPNASQDMNEVPTSPADMYMSLKMNNFNWWFNFVTEMLVSSETGWFAGNFYHLPEQVIYGQEEVSDNIVHTSN